MTAPRLTRRNALVLTALVGGGYTFATVMRAAAPLARDVSGNMIALGALDDPDSPSGGAPRGDLMMAVYTDYRCPACRQAHQALKTAVKDDGKVRVLYKDYPIFGAVSENAAQLAIAAHYQGLYEPLHDRLMTGSAAVTDNDIRLAVTAIGGSWEQLLQDRQSRLREILQRLGRVSNEAFGLGLAGTPAYLIGPMLVNGALDTGEFKQVFRQARAAKDRHRRGNLRP
jgi:protein-disulfide isomerase